MPRQISEELTHKEMIDLSTRLRQSGRRPQLEKAGWYLRANSKPPLGMFGADAVER